MTVRDNSQRRQRWLRGAAMGAVSVLMVGGIALPAAQAQTGAVQLEEKQVSESRVVTTENLVDSRMTNRFVVRYKEEAKAEDSRQGAMAAAATKTELDAGEVRERPDGTVIVAVDEVLNPEAADNFMAEMEATGNIEYIEPDTIMVPFAANDEYYERQWHFHGQNGGNVEKAWEAGPSKGADQVVAVIDSGIVSHPDLDANLVSGYDFVSDPGMGRDGDGRDSNPRDEGDWYGAYECGNNPEGADSSWHGTHVAGTVAAIADNGIGVAGVAPNAKVQPIRALAACGGYTSDIADAVLWASGERVQGAPANNTPADVINMSLGGQGQCSRTYQDAISTARANGSVVVVAAGNERQDAANVQPANCNDVITVGASAEDGSYASYSNFGRNVDITAPGGDYSRDEGIVSTLNNGKTRPGSANYAFYQGTSMATPFVSGVIAAMLAEDSSLTPDRIESILSETARPFRNGCSGCGSGLIDAGAAVAAVSGAPGSDSPETSEEEPTPSPSESAQPTEPIEPTDPWAPEQPVDPIEPTQPSEPNDPWNPSEPWDPWAPWDLETPESPENPSEPAPESDAPVDTIAPEQPSDPVAPAPGGDRIWNPGDLVGWEIDNPEPAPAPAPDYPGERIWNPEDLLTWDWETVEEQEVTAPTPEEEEDERRFRFWNPFTWFNWFV
ncbi:S8 family serine peptidase [Corynebacterium breve]|uniref:S8 family serine peptidase n=1 Tax=Corynebacterium breve TaxID=3049799 RepID=A0ABY8VFM6_9CORY|nr:S8 family serine peptidase [Corynebacterium breve]WIM68456.1 S8 family serine peptidase [Corynebacterium breve]